MNAADVKLWGTTAAILSHSAVIYASVFGFVHRPNVSHQTCLLFLILK